ncbi:MAG: RNA polymerase sigma factor [Planctomycetota bacterium]|jgi:RNA polymerase sigma factor (sigma-70 family)
MAENELVLLQRFADSGDTEAFTQIVQRHAGLVYGAGLRVLEDQNRAADVVQETFLQLLRDAGKITGSLPSWLHRVATRRALDVVRGDSRRRRREARYAADKPVKTTRWEDISLHVDQELDELEEETRKILIEHFFECRTMTDIAEQNGVSQPTVSRRIEAGVSQLRDRLRNRGVIVAAAALGSLVAQNAAQAAPAIVLKELGKIALVGGSAAASGLGSAATASGAAKTVAAGVLTGVKAKVITAAAVAAVGIGGVVTYKQVTRPAEQPKPAARVAKPITRSRPKATAAPVRTLQPARTEPTVTVVTPAEPTVSTDRPTSDKPAASSSSAEPATETTSTKAARGTGGMGGRYYFRSRAATSAEREETETEEEPNEPQDGGGSFSYRRR